jgi:DNA-binding MarR family transcriptional regulator
MITDRQVMPLIIHLARVARRTTDACIPDCLRPRQLLVLTLLNRHDPMSQHMLGEALRLDPSNVVGLLNELEELSLVTRTRDPADRRRHIVALSPAGRDELVRTNSRLHQVEDELLNALTTDERATLHDLLARVVPVVGPDNACDAQSCSADPESAC